VPVWSRQQCNKGQRGRGAKADEPVRTAWWPPYWVESDVLFVCWGRRGVVDMMKKGMGMI